MSRANVSYSVVVVYAVFTLKDHSRPIDRLQHLFRVFRVSLYLVFVCRRSGDDENVLGAYLGVRQFRFCQVVRFIMGPVGVVTRLLVR